MPKNLNVADIIQNAFDQKPTGVEDAFNSAIQAKMADAIEARRQEIAGEMHGTEIEHDNAAETESEGTNDEDV